MSETTPTVGGAMIHAFSLQLLKLLSAEAVTMADSLEGCGVNVAHVTNYITKLRSLAKIYDKVKLRSVHKPLLDLPPPPSLQTQRLLKLPRYPSYKPFGPTQSSVLDACPSNLHTSQMDVLSPSSAPPPPPSPSSPHSEGMCVWTW